VFTGIVEAVGSIVACTRDATGMRMRVDAGALDLADTSIGDSIAVAGCCLTVVELAPPALQFDVSGETLACTKGFAQGDRVNLEKALRLSDRLGGHLMSGHVDGRGTVIARDSADGAPAGHQCLEIDVPAGLARYVATKGSIGVDGVSLTANGVTGTRFTVNLIPHTLGVTTLGTLRRGDRVNIEVDVIARYVERLRERIEEK
jgi:riboflavin synthase